MGYVKKYDMGSVKVDLPTSNYLYELPLLSLADIHGGVRPFANFQLQIIHGRKQCI